MDNSDQHEPKQQAPAALDIVAGSQSLEAPSALEAIANTYVECGGNIDLTAAKLHIPVWKLRGVMDAVAIHIAEALIDKDGQLIARGKLILNNRAVTSVAMDRMVNSERAGHRWGGLAVNAMKFEATLGDLELAQDRSGTPPTIVVVSDIPKPLPIEAVGDGTFRRISDGVERDDANRDVDEVGPSDGSPST